MPGDSTQPLWKEVVIGDTEPWRRGRILLGSVAAVYLLGQVLLFLPALLTGAVEAALSLALGAAVFWLLFAFVWFGTTWVRWLLGGYAFLVALALLIWSIRDGTPLRLIGVAVNLFVGCALLAPAVHHFAARQREMIRWPEKLLVVGAFLLLMGSFFTGLVGFNLHAAVVRQEAQEYGTRALQRLFVENDTEFLLIEVSEPFRQKYGRLGLTQLLARKYMSLGEVRDLEVQGSSLWTSYAFPASFSHRGVVEARGRGDCGAVYLRVEVLQATDGWRIHGFRWRCLDW